MARWSSEAGRIFTVGLISSSSRHTITLGTVLDQFRPDDLARLRRGNKFHPRLTEILQKSTGGHWSLNNNTFLSCHVIWEKFQKFESVRYCRIDVSCLFCQIFWLQVEGWMTGRRSVFFASCWPS